MKINYLKPVSIAVCCFVAALCSKAQCMEDEDGNTEESKRILQDRRHTNKGPKAAKELMGTGNPEDRDFVIKEVEEGNKNAISGASIEKVADSGNAVALANMIKRRTSGSEEDKK